MILQGKDKPGIKFYSVDAFHQHVRSLGLQPITVPEQKSKGAPMQAPMEVDPVQPPNPAAISVTYAIPQVPRMNPGGGTLYPQYPTFYPQAHPHVIPGQYPE